MTLRTLVLVVLAAASLHAQVSFDRILHADREPHNWLSYSGTLDNQRYSRLDSINTGNVASLELEWVWQARSLEKFEATPLVVDGILYTVQAPNDVVALDAKTGRVFWMYHHEPAPTVGTTFICKVSIPQRCDAAEMLRRGRRGRTTHVARADCRT